MSKKERGWGIGGYLLLLGVQGVFFTMGGASAVRVFFWGVGEGWCSPGGWYFSLIGKQSLKKKMNINESFALLLHMDAYIP